MFILTDQVAEAERALATMARMLPAYARGTHVVHRIGNQSLIWQPFRPCDNLHLYRDGAFVGKIAFDEPECNAAIVHDELLPTSFHPLLTGCAIRTEGGSIEVSPVGITQIYACRGAVSDMQLLLAAVFRLLPTPVRFNILATAGHFPGDSTLFEEVRKIPFPGKYIVSQQQHVRLAEFSLRPADDARMVERLLSIAPMTASQLGMSAGFDSRFVLGLLLQQGVRPELISGPSEERDLVAAIARELQLDVKLPEWEDRLDPLAYTLMTDAQIFLRGGNYSRLRGVLNRDCVYHTGLAADSIIKKTYKTTWKAPGLRSRIFDTLCNFAMLGMKGPTLRGVREANSRDELVRVVRQDLAFLEPYHANVPRHVFAGLFCYFNGGLRWTPAHTADLAFYTTPVYLLADLEATEHAMQSSAWSNFRKDRVRKLNQQLLPNVRTPYSDATNVRAHSGPRGAADKLAYEYLSRFKARRKASQAAGAPSGLLRDIDPSAFQRHDGQMARYLAQPLPATLQDASLLNSVKRAAVTVYGALEYLDAAARLLAN
ncbi:MAG: hypothetical protein SGJ19_20075 [Planctomycetia bacterium]|nr:hypothetical protein [Planctomycetia bacterium]